MSPAWITGFVISGAVIVVVAALLIYILAQARRIRGLASVAAAVVSEIEANTQPIWQLHRTAKMASGLDETVQGIEPARRLVRGRHFAGREDTELP